MTRNGLRIFLKCISVCMSGFVLCGYLNGKAKFDKGSSSKPVADWSETGSLSGAKPQNDKYLDLYKGGVLQEDYYVFDLEKAWNGRISDSDNISADLPYFVGNNLQSYITAGEGVDFDKLGLQAPVAMPRYVLLKTVFKKNFDKETGVTLTNYEWLLGDPGDAKWAPQSSIDVNLRENGVFDVIINSIAVPLSDEDRAKYGVTDDFSLIGGRFITGSSYVRPLSSLTEEEIRILVGDYGNNEDVRRIVGDACFNSVLTDYVGMTRGARNR